jgi:hypothetical protein
MSAAHCTQWPPALQMGVGVPAHSAEVRHWTHDDVIVSQ